MKHEAIELYILKYPNNIQSKLFEIVMLLEEAFPELEGRIAWRMPSYSYNEIDVFHFSAQQKFISLYFGMDAMHFFEDKVSKYSRTKNVIHLQFDEEIPKDLIREVIEYNIMGEL